MSNYVESATLIVADQSSGPLRIINRELRQLARTAAELKAALAEGADGRGFANLGRSLATATADAGRFKSELAGVNAELTRMNRLQARPAGAGARSPVPTRTEGSTGNMAAQAAQEALEARQVRNAGAASSARAQATTEREANAQARLAQRERESDARTAAQAQLRIEQEAAQAQRLAERETVQAQRQAAREARDIARQQAAEARTAAREQASAARDASAAAKEAAREHSAAAKEAAQAERQRATALATTAREANRAARAIERIVEAEHRERQAVIANSSARLRSVRGRAVSAAVHEAGASYEGAMAAGAWGVGGFVAVEGALLAAKGVKESVAKSIEYQRELSRAGAQGLTEAEIKALDARALAISQQVGNVSSKEVFHTGRMVSNILPNRQDALDALPEAAKLLSIIKAQNPEADDKQSSAKVEAVFKALEEANLTRNPVDFKSGVDAMAKGMNMFGEQFDPSQYLQLVKYSRTAAMSLTPDFLTTYGPILGQELKGSTAGRELYQMIHELNADYKNGGPAREFMRLGLLSDDGAMKNASGAVVGMKGAAVTGAALAARDPAAWVAQVLVPAFDKLGLTKDERLQEYGRLFPTTASQIVAVLAEQEQRLTKEKLNQKLAADVDATKAMHDPGIQWDRLKTQFGNLGQNVGDNLSPAAGWTMGRLANLTGSAARDVKDGGVLYGLRRVMDKLSPEALLGRAVSSIFAPSEAKADAPRNVAVADTRRPDGFGSLPSFVIQSAKADEGPRPRAARPTSPFGDLFEAPEFKAYLTREVRFGDLPATGAKDERPTVTQGLIDRMTENMRGRSLETSEMRTENVKAGIARLADEARMAGERLDSLGRRAGALSTVMQSMGALMSADRGGAKHGSDRYDGMLLTAEQADIIERRKLADEAKQLANPSAAMRKVIRDLRKDMSDAEKAADTLHRVGYKDANQLAAEMDNETRRQAHKAGVRNVGGGIEEIEAHIRETLGSASSEIVDGAKTAKGEIEGAGATLSSAINGIAAQVSSIRFPTVVGPMPTGADTGGQPHVGN